MTQLDLARFADVPLQTQPFDHLVVTGFLPPGRAEAVRADFPPIAHAGLVPTTEAHGGPAFAALLEELASETVEQAFSEKFGLDLSQCALMINLRGRAQQKDGRIHTDSTDKVVTALLYLNEAWEDAGGRLRLLRGPDDIEDYVAEVPPDCGTLIAFRRCDRSFHGHKPFVGVRRCIMLNWMENQGAAGRELARHRLSSRVKRLFGVGAPA